MASIFDEIDGIEPKKQKSIFEEIDETPTSSLATDMAKRTGRSMVKMPGQVVTSGGSMLDAMERIARAYGAGQANTAQAFLPENLREKPELPATAMERELKRPSQAGRIVQKVGREMTENPQVAGIGSVDYTGNLAPDETRDRQILPMAADSVGSLAAAMVTPGGTVPKAITGALLQSSGQAEQAREFLLKKGANEDQADAEAARQFVLNLPAGALESVAWGKLLNRFGGENLLNAVSEKYGKTAAKRILKTTLEQMGVEGAEEMAQQLWGNLTAKTYNPDQKLGQGVLESGAVGAIMGGGTGAAFQGLAEGAAKLDTGSNIPERPEDLQAQQEQLKKGDRVAQMFPLGTKEAPLPKGMARVETPRGIFHFNPGQITADEILSASQAGRENEILGLGPYSKPEVDRRRQAGEPTAVVVERGPNGEELRGAAVTPSTVAETKAAMEAGKSADSTVKLERMEDTLKQRQDGGDEIDAMINQAAKEREQTLAQEQQEGKAREERQQKLADKRAQFDFHLGNAAAVLSKQSESEPSFAEVQGVQRVLQDYVDDNAVGLNLEQKQEAQARLKQLEPLLLQAKARQTAESDARIAEERRQQDAMEKALKERVRAEREKIQAMDRTGRDETGQIVDLKRIPDEELQNLDVEAEGLTVQQVEAELNRRMRAEMEKEIRSEQDQGANEDLLTVLKKIKLPSIDATMGSELTDLKNEWVNFGGRQQIFSPGEGSLDAKAEALRGFGFDDIKTPADVIEFTKRALRGEEIRPTWRSSNEQVDFAREEEAPTFYSMLERVVGQKVKGRVTADQLQATLKNNGVKDEEIDWVLGDMLAQARTDKKPITPEQLQAAIAANRVQVQEVLKGDGLDEAKAKEDAAFKAKDDYYQSQDRKYGSWDDWPQTSRNEYRRLDEIWKQAEGEHDQAKEGQKTKYHDYTLPGGTKYRELLLTLPSNEYHDALRKYGAEKGINDLAEAERSFQEATGRKPNDPSHNFDSGHFTEPNIVAHVRFNERTDNTGKRVLFIEEIQSDWHQKGARMGYGEKKTVTLKDGYRLARLDAENAEWLDAKEGDWIVLDNTDEPVVEIPYDGSMTPEQVVNAFIADANDTGTDVADRVTTRGVPDAPFKGNAWPRLLLKRMVRWAADNGFDRIAWTTGDQQATRYDLSKQVDALDVKRRDNGNFDVMAIKNDQPVNLNTDQGRNIAPDELDDFVGKDMADKIRSQLTTEGAQHTYAGLELRVGGQGMRTFYDKILVNIANDLAKKYGTRVSDGKVRAPKEDYTREDYVDALDNIIEQNRNQEPDDLLESENEDGSVDELERTEFQAAADRIKKNMDWPKRMSFGQAIASERRMGNKTVARIIDQMVHDYISTQPNDEKIHSLEIPEAMKAAVLQGQPLFAREQTIEADTGPATAVTERELADFEARFKRIAPGLAMDYRVLMGDPQLLVNLGVAQGQLTGKERAAYLQRRKIFWFLQQQIRTDKSGLMPERLRRDVLHETTHAWLDTVDEDMKRELQDEWQADRNNPDGWLADMRERGVTLRAGVKTSWQEYWAERIAEENDRWAARREAIVAKDRSLLVQIVHEFRVWLQESLELLRQAFTRTKRYNVEFREFLNQGARFVAPEAEIKGEPIAAARRAEFAREERSSDEIQQAIEENRRATEALQESNEPSDDIEARGQELAQQGKELQRELVDAKRREQAAAFVKKGSDLPGAPITQEPEGGAGSAPNLESSREATPAPAPARSTKPVLERIGTEKMLQTSGNQDIEKVAKRWQHILPGFQGGKGEMTIPVTQAVRTEFDQPAREKIRTIVDYFGGGGSWGLYQALTNFRETKRLIVHEYDADRLLKIRFFHEKGNQFAKVVAEIKPVLQEIVEAMKTGKTDSGKAGLSGSVIAALLKRHKFNTPDHTAVATAIVDWARNSFATAKDETGTKTAEAKMDQAVRIITEEAAGAYEGAQEFRQRGGTIEYQGGDSYAAEPIKGDDVLAIADPPYYRTKGYDGSKVGLDIYAKTHDFLAKLAAAKNNILYTDEAWWLKPVEEGKTKRPYEPGEDQTGERILAGIVDFFSKFDVVDAKIAKRRETLGIHHANDPLGYIPRMAGTFVHENERSRTAERRNAPRRGFLDSAKQAVLGMAGLSQKETGPLRDGGNSSSGPAGELIDRKAALLHELAELNWKIDELSKNDGSQAAHRRYLGQRSDVKVTLDDEFPGWRKEHAALAQGDETARPSQPTVPAKPTAPKPANARLKELREALAHWERQARADVIGADSWVKKHHEILDREFPDWKKTPVQPTRPLTEPPVYEQADPSDTERETAKPDREFETRANIYDQVEGHTAQPESWLQRKWKVVQDTLRTARGAIPELPAFADNKEQLYARLRQGFKLLARGTPRVWKEAADQTGEIVKPLLEAGKLDADAYSRLGVLQAKRLQLKAANRAIPTAMEQEIAALRRTVDQEPYGLFQNLALYLDLKWRVENLMDAQGNPIVLPFGINAEEINKRLADLKQKLAASSHKELILDALRKHQAMVKEIADDLKRRDLRMPDDLRNPFYFPHVMLEKDGKAVRSALDRVKMDTSEDFRGYLQKPVGSMRPIETDYAKAMYYHLVAVGSHNLRADIVRDYWAKYNEMDQVRERAKELTRKYGRGVSWKEAFHSEWAPAGYKLYAPDDKLPMHPDLQIDRNTLARRLGVMLTDEALQPQLEKLGLKGVTILPSDIREALAAGEREYWVVPEKVAEALDGIIRRETKRSESMLGKPFEMIQALWKRNILFAPWNYPRYEFNNTVADLEKLLSADPKAYGYLSQAAKEVRQFIEAGKSTPDVQAAFKLGVLETITAAEINDLSALQQFEALQTSKQKFTTQLARRASTLFLAGDRKTTDLSRLREATFRYAKFKADMERMRAGGRPIYAGAYWRDIEAIQDTTQGANDAMQKKAAEISLATFGDYHNISVAGNELRRYLIPFYSWTEINFRYHANLFHNLADMTAAGELSKAQAAKSAATAAATFSTRAAVGVMLRLALPYVAVALWNGTGWRRELEDTLSDEDKRRFHIIVGKDANGRTMVTYAQTALGDIAKWFSGQEAARLTMDVVKERTTLGTAISEWAARFPRDFANNVWQVSPLIKAGMTKITGKSTFPDVTDARSIPAQDIKWAVLGQMTDQVTAELIRRAADKDYLASKDMKDWAQQLILQVRKRDPEQWAFYDIKDQAATYLEQMTGQKRNTEYDAPDQQVLRNFRRSIYRGDVENAMRFYDRLIELGYTAERFKSSLQAQDPLAQLPKDMRRDFVEALSPADRYQLQQAYRYYTRLSEARGSEKILFPSERMGIQRRNDWQPRYDKLVEDMRAVDQMDSEQLQVRAEKEMYRSLRPSATQQPKPKRSVRPIYDEKTRKILKYELTEEEAK
jgi:hypothetical protein